MRPGGGKKTPISIQDGAVCGNNDAYAFPLLSLLLNKTCAIFMRFFLSECDFEYLFWRIIIWKTRLNK